jgi:UDP-3-O-[3-hydroxymyristoyl] N-acetylglucosamine deacetylase/3-hydroxyacyl-[acyl-carrier-protein] dehydratase
LTAAVPRWDEMKGQGMVRANRRQRTIADAAEVRGVGFFHGADVAIRFLPAGPDAGIVFHRTDLPGRPAVPARLDSVVPSQRRTTIRRGAASVEMIEHVMAALAGLQIDNAIVEIDAGECPGCDGSSRAFVEALDRVGTVEQDRPRATLVVEEPISIREGDAVLAVHPAGPAGGLMLSYHLDYGREAPIAAQSFCLGLSAESFRAELAPSRTFLVEAEAQALRAAGIGARTTEADLLVFGRDGVIGNVLRYPDECARHKVLDMVGDLALLGLDLQAFVVAYRSGHQTNAAMARRLLQGAVRAGGAAAEPIPLLQDGTIDIAGIMSVLPHRYPFLLVDRVLELNPHRSVVAIKNVSINEPFFRGHWPGMPVMPGVLIVEAMAQAAGVLIAASLSRAGRLALLASIDGVKLRRPVVPGDQLRLEVVAHRIKDRAAVVSATAKVGDALAAEARVRFVMVDAQHPPRGLHRNLVAPAIATPVR